MTKRAIPDVPKSADGARQRFDEAVKENMERMSGVRGKKIALLDAASMTGNDWTLAKKINEIIERLQ